MIRMLRASVSFIAASLFILAGSQLARADPLTFITTGTFNNIPADSGCTGNGTNQLRCSGGREITFVGSSFSQELSGWLSGSPLGTFQMVGIAPSTAVGPLIPAGITFTLSVNQSSPVPGSATFLGTIVIQPMPVASFNVLRFDQQTQVIGGFEYRVGGFFMTAGEIGLPSSVRPLPEPTTMLLLGTGLAGVVAATRRRRRTANS